MGAARGRFSRSVFINCPFDDRYWPLSEALVFTVLACGFEPRCSLEEYDSGTVRLDKIKRLLVLDSERCRYQALLSDISGQDVHTHHDSSRLMIRTVRDWLRMGPSKRRVPGPLHIQRSFRQFARRLPDYCRRSGLDRRHLPFADYAEMAREWIEAEREVEAA